MADLLSASQCKNATSNGASVRKLPDGDGLYVCVYSNDAKYWRMRYWQAGREKSLPLGVYPKVSLATKGKSVTNPVSSCKLISTLRGAQSGQSMEEACGGKLA